MMNATWIFITIFALGVVLALVLAKKLQIDEQKKQ